MENAQVKPTIEVFSQVINLLEAIRGGKRVELAAPASKLELDFKRRKKRLEMMCARVKK